MPQATKQFYVEVGTYVAPGDEEWLLPGDIEEDGMYWSRTGTTTDSFSEAEARSILAAKTYKHVRIASNNIEIIGYAP